MPDQNRPLESMEFYQDSTFLERHLIIQCGFLDSFNWIKKHWIMNTIIATIGIPFALYFGATERSVGWNTLVAALVFYGTGIAIVLLVHFIIAPIKVVRRLKEGSSEKDSTIYQLESSIRRLEPQIEGKQNLRNELETVIKEKELVIKEKESIISQLENTIETKDEMLDWYESRLKPKLELLLEKTSVAVEHYPYQNQYNPPYCRIARIAVHNNSSDTVYGIKVALKDFPLQNDSLNGRLFRLKDNFNEHSDGSFSLDPDETKEIDIALRKEVMFNEQEEGTRLRLVAPKHISRWIGDGEIIGLKIQVIARGHPAIEGRFDIYLEKSQMSNQAGEIKFFKRLMFRVSDVDVDTPTEIRAYRDKDEVS